MGNPNNIFDLEIKERNGSEWFIEKFLGDIIPEDTAKYVCEKPIRDSRANTLCDMVSYALTGRTRYWENVSDERFENFIDSLKRRLKDGHIEEKSYLKEEEGGIEAHEE